VNNGRFKRRRFKRAKQKETMKTISSVLSDGAIRPLGKVCEETGLGRDEVLKTAGIRYRASNDTVTLSDNPHKGFTPAKP
jgi:hypothetical protein